MSDETSGKLIIQCAGCAKRLQVDEQSETKIFQCPKCSTFIDLSKLSKAVPLPVPMAIPDVAAREATAGTSPVPTVNWAVPALVGVFCLTILFAAPIATYIFLSRHSQSAAVQDQRLVTKDHGQNGLDSPSVAFRTADDDDAVASVRDKKPIQRDATKIAPVASSIDHSGSDQLSLLRYRWVPGDEHVYTLKIDSDLGGSQQEITGTCGYTVRAIPKQADEFVEKPGSGLVVTSAGLIATCAHVVEDATRIEVEADGQVYSAKVVAMDNRRDTALVKIDAKGLDVFDLGDSDEIRLGETIRSCGYPSSENGDRRLSVLAGSVCGTIMHPEFGKLFQFDNPVGEGVSGGPVINAAGKVIAVVNSSIPESVAPTFGFAVPINQFRTTLIENDWRPEESKPIQSSHEKLSASQVSRRVVLIRTWRRREEKKFRLIFTARAVKKWKLHPDAVFRGSRPTSSAMSDVGSVVITNTGTTTDFKGAKNLPYALGPLGLLCLPPIDPDRDGMWQREGTRVIHFVEKERRDSPHKRYTPGKFSYDSDSPGFEDSAGRITKSYPAVYRFKFQQMRDENGRARILAEYELTSTENKERPYMTVRGKGVMLFDREKGVPYSWDYQSRMTTTPEGMPTIVVPIKVSFKLKDPAVVKAEQDRLAESIRLAREQGERERTTPNPELVDELLLQIQTTDKSYKAAKSYQRLATIFVVEGKRDDVLDVAREQLANSDSRGRMYAAEVICHWASKNNTDDLVSVCQLDDVLLYEAKETAARKIVEFGDPKSIPVVVDLVVEASMRLKIKRILISAGPDLELDVMDSLRRVSETSARQALVEVLEKIGTRKCLSMLESLLDDSHLDRVAQKAIDAVRSRM